MPGRDSSVAAVIFDLDGVLLDSETAWVEVKREFTEESGGHWEDRAQLDMLGMSSIEWSRYMHDELGIPEAPERISSEETVAAKALVSPLFSRARSITLRFEEVASARGQRRAKERTASIAPGSSGSRRRYRWTRRSATSDEIRSGGTGTPSSSCM